MTVLRRFVTSKWFKQLLPWVSALVLLAGVVALVSKHRSDPAKGESAAPAAPAGTPGAPVPVGQSKKEPPLPEDAWQVLREFVFTAVSRKKLAESYAITHPDVRSGLTLKQWETGEITVPFIPVDQIKKWNWKDTNYVTPKDVQQNVILIPTKASGQRPYYAQVALLKVGQGSNAHWLVNYFNLISGPPVPTH
jgi:hypothetical protein